MKFTLGWLKDHLDTSASLAEIAAKLTAIGLEVEDIADPGAALGDFIVAHVVEAKQHPNADRLRLCTVNTGTEILQVVCGAPNARTGLKVVLARPGVRIPASGEVLKKGVIRGVESQGMLCSARELKLGEDHDGIIELPADAPVGTPATDVLGLDPAIEIALTPNRVDALGVRGVARDLAAAGLGLLKPMDDSPVPGTFPPSRGVAMNLPPAETRKCPHFVGRTLRGLKNGPSPKWLADRLTAIGLRPISALVDVTQYLTIDLGRPLHAFDDAKLSGDIGPRLARAGEQIEALNGKTYTLDPSMVVIADRAGAQGIGGVMGGTPTSVSDGTTAIFLESALFEPANIAATGRKLQVNSDARYCFERGVDSLSCASGAEAATRMIVRICGGEVSDLAVGGAAPLTARAITFDPARVKSLGGMDIPAAEGRAILERLGFVVAGEGDLWTVTAPSWRADVEGWQDLVEEILRIHGYDRIHATPLPRSGLPKAVLSASQRQTAEVRHALAGRGLLETTTWSFLPRAQAEMFRGELPAILLANPISSDLDALRPSLVPNLAAAAVRNAARGLADVSLFEVGPRFEGVTPGQQSLIACALRAGYTTERHWAGTRRGVDAFDAKADALAILDAAGTSIGGLQTVAGGPAWYHPGRSGVLKLGNQILAAFGELHPGVAKTLDIKGPVVACEVALDRLPPPKKSKSGAARPLLKPSPFQAVERDFAFVVDAAVAADTLLRAVRNVDKELITRVALFDVFTGGALGDDKKSLAIAVTLQPKTATLTDAEIEAVSARIVAAVEKACGGRLRA